MDLYTEMLVEILSKQKIEIHFPELSFSVEELLEMRCYEALCKIKAVLEDESLTDEVCFQKIEEIINIFEEIGSDGGSRHDFGKAIIRGKTKSPRKFREPFVQFMQMGQGERKFQSPISRNPSSMAR